MGIFHTAFVGDIVLSSLLVEGLSLAGHSLVYFTKSHSIPLFLKDKRVEKSICIDKGKGLSKLIQIKKTAKLIKEQNLDVLLVPHRSSTSSLCAFFSGVPSTIGYNEASLSFLFKKTVPYKKEVHECLRLLEFLAPLKTQESIIKSCINLKRPLFSFAAEEFENFKRNFYAKKFFASDEKTTISGQSILENFAIIAVSSVWATKKYPNKNWARTISLLLNQKPSLFCVLTGGPADSKDVEDCVQELSKICPNKLNRVINLSGQLNLFEFAIFISFSKMVICNDSSPTHFAGAFNIPTITLFGPTSPSFGFAPSSQCSVSLTFADNHLEEKPLACQPCSPHGQTTCPLSHHQCLNGLQPETVARTAIVILDESKNTH